MLLLSCDGEHVSRFVAHLEWVGAKFTHRVISLEDDLCPFKYWWQSHSNMMRINCANHSESSKQCNMTIQTFLSSIFSEWWWTIVEKSLPYLFIYLFNHTYDNYCPPLPPPPLKKKSQTSGYSSRLDVCQTPGSIFDHNFSPFTHIYFPKVYFLHSIFHLYR